jgi:hypothetical protein
MNPHLGTPKRRQRPPGVLMSPRRKAPKRPGTGFGCCDRRTG